MNLMLCTERLRPSELQALFGEEDYSFSFNDILHHTEECEKRFDGQRISLCDLSFLSDPGYEKSCAAHHLKRPMFSNLEYYTKLEELKREHLRNMAELEKLYLSQIKPDLRERQLCWRPHDEDTESIEQLELIQIGSKISVGRPKNCPSNLRFKTGQNPLEEHKKLCQSQQNSSQRSANQVLRQNAKVTIPRPFRMMLREEDRKRRNVKTRSEMELENDRLKKELNELKECRKKFRAKPAPASTHLTFCDDTSKHPNKLQRQKKQINQTDHGRHGSHLKQSTQRHASPLPQQPFSFIERERKKREKKLTDELNNFSPKAEQATFKARPVPRYLFRPSSPNSQINGSLGKNPKCSALLPGILEDTLQDGENEDEFPRPQSTDVSRCSSKLRKWKNKGVLEMEKKRNKEREQDLSYIHPLQRTSTCKSDYISV